MPVAIVTYFKCSLEHEQLCSKPLRVYYYGTYHKGMCIDHKDLYYYYRCVAMAPFSVRTKVLLFSELKDIAYMLQMFTKTLKSLQ